MRKHIDPLSAQRGEAIRAFRADNCPACHAEKIRLRDPFCPECFLSLPLDLRDAFAVRSRFIELFHPAMEHLRVLEASRVARTHGEREALGVEAPPEFT